MLSELVSPLAMPLPISHSLKVWCSPSASCFWHVCKDVCTWLFISVWVEAGGPSRAGWREGYVNSSGTEQYNGGVEKLCKFTPTNKLSSQTADAE